MAQALTELKTEAGTLPSPYQELALSEIGHMEELGQMLLPLVL